MRPALGVQATVRVRGFADPEGGAVPAPGRASASPRACTSPPLRRKASYVYLVLFGGGSGGVRTAAHNAVYIKRPLRGVLLLRRLAGRQR